MEKIWAKYKQIKKEIFFGIVFFLFSFSSIGISQNTEKINLDNVVVVSLQNEISDRYSIEVAMLQLFTQYKIKAKAALNVVKQEGSPEIIANDSIQNILKEKGYDTYLLISVRGYDQKFKPSSAILDLEKELEAGHLYPIYRDNATRVTFSFTFYKNSKPVHHELIRTGSVSSREATINKLLKKAENRLLKSWI